MSEVQEIIVEMMTDADRAKEDYGVLGEPVALHLRKYAVKLQGALHRLPAKEEAGPDVEWDLTQTERQTGWSNPTLRRRWKDLPAEERRGKKGAPRFIPGQIRPKPGHVPPAAAGDCQPPPESLRKRGAGDVRPRQYANLFRGRKQR